MPTARKRKLIAAPSLVHTEDRQDPEEPNPPKSLLLNKTKTVQVKPLSFPEDIPITRSFTTTDGVSIAAKEELTEFWNDSSTDLSEKLWLPAKTTSLDLGTTSSKLFSIDVAPESLLPKEPKKLRATNNQREISPQTPRPVIKVERTTEPVKEPTKITTNKMVRVTGKPRAIAIARRSTARPKKRSTKTSNKLSSDAHPVKTPKIQKRPLTESEQMDMELDEAVREIEEELAQREFEIAQEQALARAQARAQVTKAPKYSEPVKQPKIQREYSDSESDDFSSDGLIDVPESVVIDSPTKTVEVSKEETDDTYICRKIRIFPTNVQKKYFHKCFGTSRYIYNTAVRHVNNRIDKRDEEIAEAVVNGCVYLDKKGDQCCGKFHKDSKRFCKKHIKTKGRYGYNINTSRTAIRRIAAPADKRMPKGLEWQKEVPYDTRQFILDDFIAAYNSASTNARNGNIKSFRMGFKSRHDKTQIFHVNKKAINTDLTIFSSKKLGKLRIRTKMQGWFKKNIKQIDRNCKIIRYRDGSYYLLLSIKRQKTAIKRPFDIVSTDPGVRTFQTIYSPNGITGMFGDGIIDNRLMPIAKKIDHFNSVLSKSKGRTRRNLKRRMALLRTKIKNVVNNLHWETIGFLTRNFNTIITTTFEVKEMTSKSRSISSKASRKMLTLSHGAFREKLISRAIQTGNRLIIANESYTSKTCGNCGNIKKDLGARKWYSCDECGMRMHRDINGARNIMIRTYSTESESA